MKKLLLILFCLPVIGFSQFGNYTNSEESSIYFDLLNYSGAFGQELIIDPNFESKKIATGSIGFENSRSFKFLMNKRLNYGIDFFQYKLLDKNILQNFNLPNTTPLGKGGIHYSYYRFNAGLGTGILFTEHSTSTLNLDLSAYFNQKGKATENMTFTTLGLNINLKSNFSIPLLSSFFSDYQFKLGYYIIPPRLSSYMLNEGYSNGTTQLQQSYIEMPRLYVSLKKNFYSNNSSKRKKVKIKKPKPPKKPITSKKNGCVSGKCKNGKGEYISYIGTYKGRFKNGAYHGKGIMYYADGSSYNGEWRMGNRHGKGTYISADKEELSGDWIDNKIIEEVPINDVNTKISAPPSLMVDNILFNDFNSNNLLEANEQATISFNIKNIGKGSAYGISIQIDDANNIQGLSYDRNKQINILKPQSVNIITIPLSASMSLATGESVFSITISEGNGFDVDPIELSIPTQSFIPPNLEIVDFVFISDIGEMKLGEKVNLQFAIQNIGQGIAEDIQIRMLIPGNVFAADETNYSINKLNPGEKKLYDFSFFTNKRFSADVLNITAKLSEKYDKYAKDKIMSVKMEEDISNAIALNIESSITIENIKIDRFSLTSHVDKNIPVNSKVNNRFALVIGNEDYVSYQSGLQKEQNVDYAVNDATIFEQYALKTLGVKSKNMFSLINATSGVMSQKLKQVIELIKLEGDDAELIIYYAGHGFPDDQKVPHLIPVDVSGGDLSRAINLQELYKDLGKLKAKRVTVFLDACFTGDGRNLGLVASRGPKVNPKEGDLSGNLVVFSASSGAQTSFPFHKEKHGIFTYHLFKTLQVSDGDISYGALDEILKVDVDKTSLRNESGHQTPEVNTSSKVVNDWRNWKF